MRKTSLLITAVLLGFTGCVERTLSVRTDPPGALVEMNDLEIGRTPVERDFEWYGKYDVTVRKDGYQTVKTQTTLDTPWYELVPLDLVAELLPFKFHDRQQVDYQLVPTQTEPGHAGELLDRAKQMQGELGIGLRTHIATQPISTTQPTPTTQP